jgi:hypothetical protein
MAEKPTSKKEDKTESTTPKKKGKAAAEPAPVAATKPAAPPKPQRPKTPKKGKLPKKNKSRLPRKQKKAQHKAAGKIQPEGQ